MRIGATVFCAAVIVSCGPQAPSPSLIPAAGPAHTFALGIPPSSDSFSGARFTSLYSFKDTPDGAVPIAPLVFAPSRG
jgi:hypothetical protein